MRNLGESGTMEVYQRPELKSADEVHIVGQTGKTTTRRLDTLDKLMRDGKINHVQYSAGMDYLRIVENYFASASGFAKLSDEAGRVGGDGDPIRLYLKARPWREGKGYIPTQRPRNPTQVRPRSDGWNKARFDAMGEFSRMARLVSALPRDSRQALCVLVIDPNRPDLPALSIAAACRRMLGSDRARSYATMTRWLIAALNEIDGELLLQRQAA